MVLIRYLWPDYYGSLLWPDTLVLHKCVEVKFPVMVIELVFEEYENVVSEIQIQCGADFKRLHLYYMYIIT